MAEMSDLVDAKCKNEGTTSRNNESCFEPSQCYER